MTTHPHVLQAYAGMGNKYLSYSGLKRLWAGSLTIWRLYSCMKHWHRSKRTITIIATLLVACTCPPRSYCVYSMPAVDSCLYSTVWVSSTSSSSYLLFAFIAAPHALELTLIGNKFCLALACFGSLFLSLFYMIQHSYMTIVTSFTYDIITLSTMNLGRMLGFAMRNFHTPRKSQLWHSCVMGCSIVRYARKFPKGGGGWR